MSQVRTYCDIATWYSFFSVVLSCSLMLVSQRGGGAIEDTLLVRAQWKKL